MSQLTSCLFAKFNSQLFAIVSALSCILLAAAEPPVPSSYLPPRQNSPTPPSSHYLPPSTSYGFPSTEVQGPTTYQPRPTPQRPSSQYGAPSQQYGAPSAPSQQYGAPSAPSQQYGAPSAPSQQYGAPSAPSQQYGAPANSYQPQASGYADSNGYTNGGYEKSAEPAKYSFEYNVNDYQSGNDFGHMESRDGDKTVGRYYVLLPDGRKQIVTYEADQNGYRPTITYEEANQGQNGNGYANSNGYNNNGQFNGY